jgi:hypothetical protein
MVYLRGAPGFDSGVPSDRSSSLGRLETWDSDDLERLREDHGRTTTDLSGVTHEIDMLFRVNGYRLD